MAMLLAAHDLRAGSSRRGLDSLVDAVRANDPGATDGVALPWRIVMAPGIEFMKFYRTR